MGKNLKKNLYQLYFSFFLKECQIALNETMVNMSIYLLLGGKGEQLKEKRGSRMNKVGGWSLSSYEIAKKLFKKWVIGNSI